jgi:hypothetical protein
MTFSILHTSARPEKWREVYDAWIAAADRPEDVEYVLVVDKRWGFSLGVSWATWTLQRGADDHYYQNRVVWNRNRVVWNNRRRCYVDGVNLAAEHATGDVLIVNADDQYPCPHWDTILSKEFTENAENVNNPVVVWANTLTPGEIERRIMPMPILTQAYYKQKGYVFYPKYESMYADNDFCEQALYERDHNKCHLLMLADDCVFPHRHPYFDATVTDDAVYQAQNRSEAYELGAGILAARRANRFTDVSDDDTVSASTSTPVSTAAITHRRRIAVCISGEWFPASWLVAWTELMQLTRYHDLVITFATSSNVHVTRMELAKQALSIRPQADYILWIDDDNIVTPQQVLQLITDLEHVPHASLVAGWTITGAPVLHSNERTLSCGRFKPTGITVPMAEDGLLGGVEDLKEVDYTGFPVVLMRRSLLEELGAAAFAPLLNTHHRYGFHSEDVSFCSRARDEGHRLFVDRRVAVPHLKLRDIMTIVCAAEGTATASVAPDLPRLTQEETAAARTHSRSNVESLLANAAV